MSRFDPRCVLPTGLRTTNRVGAVGSGARDEEDKEKMRKVSWRRNLLTCFALPTVEQVADGGPEPPGLFLTGEVEADLAGLRRGRTRRRRQRGETPADDIIIDHEMDEQQHLRLRQRR